LREDLRLLPGPSAADGSPSWTLYDPAIHRFMRIGWQAFEILKRWPIGDATALAQAVSRETLISTTPDDVADMVRFASRAGLLQPLGPDSSQSLAALVKRQKLSPHRWLLKNYLFLRLTLLDPDRLLSRILPWVSWMFRSWFPMALAIVAAFGLFLVGRHWDSFTHEFSYGFSLEGALLTGVALTIAKVAHEFGHGLAAKRFGCRVPAMGVAFLVLWPVLWTDVTDSWKLTDRRQRLIIDSAGMAAEILLAVAASLLWSLLPEGPARSAAFLLAGSTWVMTLLVNLNPFMRFDGYFLLSDALDIPNLQERSFALGRWWLRETLFGLSVPAPESLPPKRHWLLIGYALSVWGYRFFMFLGIALLVYHMAFKLLGFFLMAVEIWWFIARPILNELMAWASRKSDLRWNLRTIRTAGLSFLLLLATLIPWQSQLTAPALLRAGRQVTLATAQSGQLVEFVQDGNRVEKNQPVFTLESPGLSIRRQGAIAMAAGLRARLSGLSFSRSDVDQMDVSWREFEQGVAEIQDIDAKSDELVVRAPFDGVIVDLSPSLRSGLWMAKHEALGILIESSSSLAEAYVAEADITRLYPGSQASFIPEDNGPATPMTVVRMDSAATRELDNESLSSLHGGSIAVRQDASHKLIPEHSLYRVILAPREQMDQPIRHTRRGIVKIAAERSSLVRSIWRMTMAALVRESGL
jgi:putative peptide zinc metalloprotease protein